jgi:hypothetical protein
VTRLPNDELAAVRAYKLVDRPKSNPPNVARNMFAMVQRDIAAVRAGIRGMCSQLVLSLVLVGVVLRMVTQQAGCRRLAHIDVLGKFCYRIRSLYL